MTSTRRRLCLCALLVALPTAAIGKKVAGVSLDDWYEIQAPNFSLYSASDRKSVVDLAKRLLSFIEVARQTTNIDRFQPRVPIRIIVFDSSDFRQLWGFGNAGWMDPGTTRFTLAVNGDIGSGTQILLHEYTHYLVHNQGMSYPRWFDEGFAELISTVRFREDLAYIGAPPTWRTDQLRSTAPMLPLEGVLGAREYPPGKARLMFYAQAWLLTHYLHTAHAYGDPKLIGSMQRYLEMLQGNTPWATAFDRAFEPSVDQLAQRLIEHRSRVLGPTDRLPMLTLQIALPDFGQLRMRGVAPARIAEVLGDSVAAVAEGTRTAENFYRASLELAPNRSTARAGLARVLAQQGRVRRALVLATEAAVSDPGSLSVRLALGEVKALAAKDESPANTALLEEAREIFRTTIERQPTHPAAYAGLAETFVDIETDVAEGIRALEQLRAETPTLAPALTLAKLYLAADRRNDARTELRKVVRWHGGDEADEARELLKKIAREDAAELELDD